MLNPRRVIGQSVAGFPKISDVAHWRILDQRVLTQKGIKWFNQERLLESDCSESLQKTHSLNQGDGSFPFLGRKRIVVIFIKRF